MWWRGLECDGGIPLPRGRRIRSTSKAPPEESSAKAKERPTHAEGRRRPRRHTEGVGYGYARHLHLGNEKAGRSGSHQQDEGEDHGQVVAFPSPDPQGDESHQVDQKDDEQEGEAPVGHRRSPLWADGWARCDESARMERPIRPRSRSTERTVTCTA